VCACLVQEQAAVVARHAPEYEPGRDQAADLDERLRDRVGADDHVHRDGVPAIAFAKNRDAILFSLRKWKQGNI